MLVDEPAGPFTLTVWADPDVGTGTFFVDVVGPATDAPGAAESATPAPGSRGAGAQAISVVLEARPLDAHRDVSRHPAEPDPAGGSGGGSRFRASVPFDAEGPWQVRLVVASGERSGEAQVEVDVSPPGPSFAEAWIYLAPFAAIGVLWLIVFARTRRASKSATP